MITDKIVIGPADTEAELTVLAGMAVDQVAIPAVSEVLPPESSDWFTVPAHAAAYRVFIDMYEAGIPMGLVSVADELARRGELEAVGGRDFLVLLGETFSHAAEAEYCAKIVQRKAMLRRLMTMARWLHDAAEAPDADPQELVEAAEDKLKALAIGMDTGPARKPGQEVVNAIAETMSQEPGDVCGLETGLVDLDRATGGLKPGNMIVLAARPSMGKSSLAIHIAQHQAIDCNVPVLFFSLEMTRREILEAVASMRSGVNLKPERGHKWTDEERRRMREQAELLRDAPLFIDESDALKIRELRARARKMHALYGIQAIFIDYLQLVTGPKSENRQVEVASVSRGIKAMAKELSVPVVALCQLNRAVEGRDGNRPRLADLRETGQIEQDADVVGLLHRPEYYGVKGADYLAELNIAKQRRGPTCLVRLHFARQTTSFHNWHKEPGDVPPPRQQQYEPEDMEYSQW